MATTPVPSNPVSLQALKSKPEDYYILTTPEVNLLVLLTDERRAL